MVSYILLGAVLGVFGYLMLPGHFFWFVIGGLSGYLVHRYVNRR